MQWSWLPICALLAGLLMQPADARERNKQRGERQELQRDLRDDRGNEPAQAAAQLAVKANGGGRVLSVDRDGDGYRVKVLKEGEVRTHHITLE